MDAVATSMASQKPAPANRHVLHGIKPVNYAASKVIFQLFADPNQEIASEVRGLQDDEANMDSLIAHVEFDQETGSYISSNKNSVVEIEATLIPFSPRPDPRNPEDILGNQSTRLKIFPDSGATICLGGPKHLYCMDLKESNLIPSKKVIRAVGGSTLISPGWLPVQFSVGEMSTKQALYICNNIDKLYFSKAACIDVGILSPPISPHLCL